MRQWTKRKSRPSQPPVATGEPLLGEVDGPKVWFWLPTDLSSLKRTGFYASAALCLLTVFVVIVAGWNEIGPPIVVADVGLVVFVAAIYLRELAKFKVDRLVFTPTGWVALKDGETVMSGQWDSFIGFRLKKNTRISWVEFVGVDGDQIARITLGTSLLGFDDIERFRRELLSRVPRFGVKEVFTPVREDSERDRFIGIWVAVGSVLVVAWIVFMSREDANLISIIGGAALLLGTGILIASAIYLQGKLAQGQLAMIEQLGPTEFTSHAARPVGQFLGNFLGLTLLGGVAALLLGAASNGLGLGNVFWIAPIAILVSLPGHYVLGIRHLFIQHDKWTVSDGRQTMSFDPLVAEVSERRRFGLTFGRFVQIEEEGRKVVICNDAIGDTTIYRELLWSQKRARIDSPLGFKL